MNANKLKKIALKAQNRKTKKQVINYYKIIKRNLKKIAKRGQTRLEYNIYVNSKDGLEQLIAFRFFKIKHKDFKVIIIKHIDSLGFQCAWYDSKECRVIIEFINTKQ